MQRIEKFLADALNITRSSTKSLIKAGRIQVNGKLTKAGALINDSDIISLDGEAIKSAKKIYLMMNKAAGAVCTKSEGGQYTVFDALDDEYKSTRIFGDLHTVGRLDIDTTGLLILTTDGALTHKIISNNSTCNKTYQVTLQEAFNEEEQGRVTELFSRGIFVKRDGREKEFRAKSATIKWLTSCECLLTISEGKFHQVKRMFIEVGNRVTALKRVAIGGLHLDESLEEGDYRVLSDDEVEAAALC